MPVAVPAASQSTSRYAYLVSRLRNRQITMEEATELFALQQTMIARASVMNLPPPPPAPPDDSTVATPPPRTVASGGNLPINDETVTLALLGMGVGAGLLAAVLKRARDGPKPTG
jgi:hypothetical protein